ncbi:hypothetical protein ACIQVO_38120 [Streptomyces sp. NPDC101062]|uniref:hypothetical protein n=1 Tax=unclassified Streptomyces TaxID=2593676 RepID=UPI00380D9608
MVRAASYSVRISVDRGVPDRLGVLVDSEKVREVVLSAAPQWWTHGLGSAEAARVRGQWRKECQRLRSAGELLDTRDAVASYGVREELRARGWDHDEWPEAPEEAWGRGRWPGSRDCGFPEHVSVRLEAELFQRTVRACWETSREAIGALRRWRDEHPGITPARYRRTGEGLAELVGPLAEYERLALQVTVTGVIWRAGLAHGIARLQALPLGAGGADGSAGSAAGEQGNTTA